MSLCDIGQPASDSQTGAGSSGGSLQPPWEISGEGEQTDQLEVSFHFLPSGMGQAAEARPLLEGPSGPVDACGAGLRE